MSDCHCLNRSNMFSAAYRRVSLQWISQKQGFIHCIHDLGLQACQGFQVHVCSTGRSETRSRGQRVWGGGVLQAALQDQRNR